MNQILEDHQRNSFLFRPNSVVLDVPDLRLNLIFIIYQS